MVEYTCFTIFTQNMVLQNVSAKYVPCSSLNKMRTN